MHKLFYDEGDDSLTFLGEARDAAYTEDTGLVLLSFNKRKQIVGMQLMGVHENFNVPKNILHNISKADVNFSYHKESKQLIMKIALYCKKKEPVLIFNNFQVSDFLDTRQTLSATA